MFEYSSPTKRFTDTDQLSISDTLYYNCLTYLPRPWFNAMFTRYDNVIDNAAIRYTVNVDLFKSPANQTQLKKAIDDKYDTIVVDTAGWGSILLCIVGATLITILEFMTIDLMVAFGAMFACVVLIYTQTWRVRYYRRQLALALLQEIDLTIVVKQP